MASPAPSLRDLARQLGLSHTTVSEALRDNPRVKAATRERVQVLARAAGYRHNPLAGALMAEMRRSRTGTFRGVIAVIDLDGPDRRPDNAARYHQELIRGATERAAELGFKAEPFVIGHRGISAARLDHILQSRGIRGVFLLPVSDNPDISRLDWKRYAGIYADYIIERPGLHSVCADHFRSMIIALQHLQALGYRRPGLVLEKHHDERLLHRWEAAFRSHQDYHQELARISPLMTAAINQDEFNEWFRQTRPDVVLCHRAEVVQWMRSAGAEVPKTHGFCSLNLLMSATPCAGLNLQAALIGSRGVELIIAQLYRNEYGVPDHPSVTTIPGVWVDGPTLRAMDP